MLGFLKRLFEKNSNVQTEPNETAGSIPPRQEPVYSKPMKLRAMGDGDKVNYQPGGLYSCTCLWWVSEEADVDGEPIHIRESHEKTEKVPAALPFVAAGKLYRNLHQLSPQDVLDGVDVDVYGRQVLCYRERFPCFDSYDYLHEHRYYRWFFLKENGKLTRIYTADESGWIHITEDAENIESKCVELMKRFDWVE